MSVKKYVAAFFILLGNISTMVTHAVLAKAFLDGDQGPETDVGAPTQPPTLSPTSAPTDKPCDPNEEVCIQLSKYLTDPNIFAALLGVCVFWGVVTFLINIRDMIKKDWAGDDGEWALTGGNTGMFGQDLAFMCIDLAAGHTAGSGEIAVGLWLLPEIWSTFDLGLNGIRLAITLCEYGVESGGFLEEGGKFILGVLVFMVGSAAYVVYSFIAMLVAGGDAERWQLVLFCIFFGFYNFVSIIHTLASLRCE